MTRRRIPGQLVEDSFAIVGVVTVATAIVAPVVVAACVVIERWQQRRAAGVTA